MISQLSWFLSGFTAARTLLGDYLTQRTPLEWLTISVVLFVAAQLFLLFRITFTRS